MADQIQEIKKVYYPLEEAIQKAAEQNFNRDLRQGLVDENERDEEMALCVEEARTVLEQTGENYIPEFPDTEHICVENHVQGQS